MLNITTRGTLCTGVLIAPTVLLTAPACFLDTEAPLTLPSSYDGSFSNLTAYPIQASNPSATVIGFAVSHYYVYNTGQEGYRLSVVNFTRLSAADDLGIPYYDLQTADLTPPIAALSGGFGPSNLTVSGLLTSPVGAGAFRMANVTLTSAGQSVRRIGKCSGYRIGGNLYMDKITRLAASYVRMCGQYGDMGAPMLLDSGNGSLLVTGTLIDVDVYPCAVNKAIYTSIPFRQEWVKAKVELLTTAVRYPAEYCPSATPSPSATASHTVSASPSASIIINVTVVVVPPPTPFPWWWVVTILSAFVAVLLVAAAIVWYVRRWTRLQRAAVEYDKAMFTRPHPDHVSAAPDLGGLAQQQEDEAELDPSAVADELYEAAAAGAAMPGGAAPPNSSGGGGGKTRPLARMSGYERRINTAGFMVRLAKRIER
jgi:HAMP domain-containing protein